MVALKKIIDRAKWWYWSGRFSKIKLFHVDTIGVDQGYFECHSEHHKVMMQYFDDIKKMELTEASRILDERSMAVRKKYFGPRYVRVPWWRLW